MWQLAVLALASAQPGPDAGLTIQGLAFGPRQRLSCTWFTNFENSRFEKCQVLNGEMVPLDDGASIKCVEPTCKQMDAEARRISNWRKPDAPQGTFTVQFFGRVSIDHKQKKYLGDTTMTVLVEKLLSIRQAE